MRIVVLGDFHLNVKELDLTQQAMEDIAACSPDLVVPLGDFGCNASIGGVEGLEQAYRYLGSLPTPLRPILGNHDMQRETGRGRGTQPRGTMERAFLERFQLDDLNGVQEFETFRLFWVGTDLQPPDSCYMEQECYVTDEHFAALERKLKERPGVPCIFFTHAPPAGAGLRTVPRVHVRATNAYLDQNHHYDRWMKLVREHPEIVMWFSAHYHLGHDHPDSMTLRHGTTFFITGVHGSCTRDGSRQSRVIDIEGDRVRVSTLDHTLRKVRKEADWSGLLQVEAKVLAGPPVSANQPRLVSSCAIGDEPVIPGGLIALDEERCLTATQDGFLWEIRPLYEAVMGSLHLGPPLSAALLAEDGVWRVWDHTLVRCDPDSLWRFQRYKPEETYKDMTVLQLEQPIRAVAPRIDGGLWIACGRELLAAGLEGADSIGQLPSPVRRLIVDGSDLYALTEDGTLYRMLLESGVLKDTVECGRGFLTWDIFNGAAAGIALDEAGGSCFAVYTSPTGEEASVSLGGDAVSEFTVSAADDDDTIAGLVATPPLDVCLLEQHRVLLHIGDALYVWTIGEPAPIRLPTDTASVHAVSRMPAGSQASARFALCTAGDGMQSRPQLQLWEWANEAR
ncbi:metallophosphoesterase family protein [Paenibacillus cremeus]|uniref:Calcineurin-like phosphoesterase domain-containing protein n=1 Tax=Paenibacillus cremeus TaxID=2163881 RepID=A0A559K5B6_9BACL|nr:metallophosphoesterase [Paenibacillus cremeus]TVY07329.1 hypothetical protein FPZ49_24620 [Paenibacillus cremeus]